MPNYFIQNPLGQYLTADTLWTSDKARALRFEDVRSVIKVCEREKFHDAQMMIDFPDLGEAPIAVPVRDASPGRR
jgi:hypothetical protein